MSVSADSLYANGEVTTVLRGAQSQETAHVRPIRGGASRAAGDAAGVAR